MTQLIVGRASACGLVVSDESVSARHCRVVSENGIFTVVDLGSTNGTFVNGKRVSTQLLVDGDKVSLGLVAFEFRKGRLHRLAEPPPSSHAPAKDTSASSQGSSLSLRIGGMLLVATLAFPKFGEAKENSNTFLTASSSIPSTLACPNN